MLFLRDMCFVHSMFTRTHTTRFSIPRAQPRVIFTDNDATYVSYTTPPHTPTPPRPLCESKKKTLSVNTQSTITADTVTMKVVVALLSLILLVLGVDAAELAAGREAAATATTAAESNPQTRGRSSATTAGTPRSVASSSVSRFSSARSSLPPVPEDPVFHTQTIRNENGGGMTVINEAGPRHPYADLLLHGPGGRRDIEITTPTHRGNPTRRKVTQTGTFENGMLQKGATLESSEAESGWTIGHNLRQGDFALNLREVSLKAQPQPPSCNSRPTSFSFSLLLLLHV